MQLGGRKDLPRAGHGDGITKPDNYNQPWCYCAKFKAFAMQLKKFASYIMLAMGGKPAKLEKKEELGLKIVPPVDRAYARWLARDLERIYGFTPRNPCAIKPPDHYIEYMRLNGWLDLNLDDPDLAHLFK
ncbi:hypothetical protein Sango_0492200 [Sesamum angolense]|uniref:Uncharacterized protein n=1 Tax=Sesamum angolense TaxID=2727404 RepID=A0AAE2C4T8_9LAMI|nr:hypothetical protein Sango_0492200 [Sesamum angolense]